MTRIVLATRNQHKIRELSYFLGGLPVEILTLNDFPAVPPLVEDGTTFRENALKKGRRVFEETGVLSLADDSGLEVFFLNGRPGYQSARYAGPETDDEANNEKLLGEMRAVAPRRRRAQFRAVLALIGNGIEEITEGTCLGKLAESPRGTNGFGYDPIFVPDGFNRTYAQLTSDEKNRISHRSKAFGKMRDILKAKVG